MLLKVFSKPAKTGELRLKRRLRSDDLNDSDLRLPARLCIICPVPVSLIFFATALRVFILGTSTLL